MQALGAIGSVLGSAGSAVGSAAGAIGSGLASAGSAVGSGISSLVSGGANSAADFMSGASSVAGDTGTSIAQQVAGSSGVDGQASGMLSGLMDSSKGGMQGTLADIIKTSPQVQGLNSITSLFEEPTADQFSKVIKDVGAPGSAGKFNKFKSGKFSSKDDISGLLKDIGAD